MFGSIRKMMSGAFSKPKPTPPAPTAHPTGFSAQSSFRPSPAGARVDLGGPLKPAPSVPTPGLGGTLGATGPSEVDATVPSEALLKELKGWLDAAQFAAGEVLAVLKGEFEGDEPRGLEIKKEYEKYEKTSIFHRDEISFALGFLNRQVDTNGLGVEDGNPYRFEGL